MIRTTAAAVLFLLSLPALGDDSHAIAVYRDGLQAIVRHLDRAPIAGKVPTREERDEARLLWKSFLDYELALETIRGRHDDFLEKRGAARDRAFRTYHAAWLAQYRAAIDFIARMERHPELHTMLNERAFGLGENTYSDFKLRWLNVARGVELSVFALADATFGGKPLPGAREDAKAIVGAAKWTGPTQTLKNAARIVHAAIWEPIPEGLAVVAGGPESAAPRPSYISKAQIAKMRTLVQPGDILFERRDWALTNAGLPGFWPHVALYVGTPAERRLAFGDAFETRLRARDPRKYEDKLASATVIEAIGEGVRAAAFEHSADADYVAIIRPRVSPLARQLAIERSFAALGLPYDFEFDFVTDDRIVCSELIWKAYEGALPLPVLRMAGRAVTPPNDFVRWFDELYDSPTRPADFVAFFDRAARGARESDIPAFRESWRREKWHPVMHWSAGILPAGPPASSRQ